MVTLGLSICSIKAITTRHCSDLYLPSVHLSKVEQKRNVMAHAQKPDLVSQRNGRVHLYRRGCQFSRLLAAEVCASAVVMLDRRCPIQCTTAGYPLHSPFFPFTSPPVRFRVPSHSVSALQKAVYHSGIIVFNCLPPMINSLSSDMRKFKSAS